jgi:hypothetical protein
VLGFLPRGEHDAVALLHRGVVRLGQQRFPLRFDVGDEPFVIGFELDGVFAGLVRGLKLVPDAFGPIRHELPHRIVQNLDEYEGYDGDVNPLNADFNQESGTEVQYTPRREVSRQP